MNYYRIIQAWVNRVEEYRVYVDWKFTIALPTYEEAEEWVNKQGQV